MKNEVVRIERGMKRMGAGAGILDFSVQIYRGEICGLLVENNRERKMLIQILSGEERMDYGWVYVFESLVKREDYLHVLKDTVRVINRQERCVPQLKVKENVFVVQQGISWWRSVRKLCTPAGKLFEFLECPIDPEETTGNLPPLQRKAVELIHAYVSGKKLIVLADMDEFFTEETMPLFFQLVIRLKNLGMDFLIVSNNTKVLFRYTEYMYIFAHGRTRHRILRSHYDLELLYSVMLEEVKQNSICENCTAGSREVLKFDQVETRYGVKLDFVVHEREIVNYVSSDYESWRMPAAVLSGEEAVKKGCIYVMGEKFSPHMFSDAAQNGIGILEENSHEAGMYLEGSVLDNILMLVSGKIGLNGFSSKYVTSLEKELLSAGAFTRDELYQSIYLASSHTIQKMSYFCWIMFRPKVMICLRPFSSADYTIQKLTCDLIQTAVRHGIAVLILSMSFSEASIVGSRILYNKRGKIYETDRENIEKLF
ncbi:MAG: hypothetical protein ACOX8E_04940 [Ruminococcus sp.]